MREIAYSSRYKRDLKRMIRRGANLALHDEALALLVADAPLPERYRDHKR
ncbi:type II toxin-antitoxin system RelE/ParE family toxin [Synergistes jonesii]|nr:type II toxin-antitoxin system YafQ family toxin [Synergistes jonesii]